MKVDWKGEEVIAAIDKAAAGDCLEAAKLVARTAKRTRLFNDKSGELRKSIQAEKSKFKGGGAVVTAGNARAWYAPKVELGHKGTPARPFLRRAKKQCSRAIKRIFQGKQ